MLLKYLIKPSGFGGRKLTTLTPSVATVASAVDGALPELILLSRDHSQANSRKSRSLRAEGKIPGVMYGFDKQVRSDSLLFTISKKQLMDQLRAQGKSFENTVYNARIEGDDKVYSVIPRQTQFSPITDMPFSVNLLIRNPSNVFRIPVEFENEIENQDLKRGSYVIRVNQFIQCTCDGDVPRNIPVDLSSTPKGAVIKLSDLKLPPNVKPAKNVPLDLVVCVIKASRSK